jgi:putative SOS response-associated peptidase YedK
MCGKFTQMMSWQKLCEYADLLGAPDSAVETTTPMRFATIIRLDENGRRETQRMRWGFSRRNAKSPSERPEHIHARAETLDTKPTFREAFAERRGILVVRTFNEGKEITPSKTEQHTVTPRDGKPLGIAVLWEHWMHDTGGELYTFVMVTVDANRLIGTITDRMPAVVPSEPWGTWLGESPAASDELKALLVPFEGDWDMAPEVNPKKAARASRPDPQPGLF